MKGGLWTSKGAATQAMGGPQAPGENGLGFRPPPAIPAAGQALLLRLASSRSGWGVAGPLQAFCNCLLILLSKISWKAFQLLPLLIISHHPTLPQPNIRNQSVPSHCTCKKQQGTVLNH